MYTPKADGSGYETTGTWGIAFPRSQAIDLKIELQGANELQTNGSIVRTYTSAANVFKSLTIVGVDGGSLTGVYKTSGIQDKYGVPITIEDANIELSTRANTTNATTAVEASAIYTNNADITIKNSNLKLSGINAKDAAIYAVCAAGTGNIKVTNSDLELTSSAAAFNKAPVLSDNWTAVAGDDAASAVTVTDAAALATAKYVKLHILLLLPVRRAPALPPAHLLRTPVRPLRPPAQHWMPTMCCKWQTTTVLL